MSLRIEALDEALIADRVMREKPGFLQGQRRVAKDKNTDHGTRNSEIRIREIKLIKTTGSPEEPIL